MASGLSARAALDKLVTTAPHVAFRQLHLVDRHGGTAAYSGANTLGTHTSFEGSGVVAAGNILKSKDVPCAMVAAFEAASAKPLGDRIVAGMQAALAAGGEEGPVHSAGMLVVRDVSWPIADLRVDWHDTDPVGALATLWEQWKPQMEAYVTRALNPTAAPSFGVPGDK
jgi:uncharacterized Ntn-hydrolase superfamily protein